MGKNDNTIIFLKLEQDYKRIRQRLPNQIAITAVNFFKRNFKVGGFVDRPFKKWKEVGGKNKRGKTLVKSGNLRRAIKKLRVTRNKVVVGINKNIPYAQIHNDGGKIPITPKMRRWAWYMFKKTNNELYKGIALTSKTHLDIPERKFIGDSIALDITLQRMILKQLNTLTK